MNSIAAGSHQIRLRFLSAVVTGLLFLPVLVWFAVGCASSSSRSSAPKPGSGIAEYRQVVRDAHRGVASVVDSLEGLLRSFTPPATVAGLDRFDRALHQLELTSVRTRSRAEAIIARGQAYFDEWKENLSGITNSATAHDETARYGRLVGYFEGVRNRSGEVREEFRLFMARLREFRARLDKPAGAPATASVQQDLGELTASGQRVLQALESVSTALDEAEVELRATLAAKR